MSQESFEKEFSKLRELGEGIFKLRGSTIIVEVQPDAEIKTKGGIYIASVEEQVKGNSVHQHKLQVAKVLMIGEGYYNEESEQYEPLDLEVGAIVILPQYSPQYISAFPSINRPTSNKLAMVKYDAILAFFPSQEAFETAKAKLN